MMFQSTPPARGATIWEVCGFRFHSVSIHAPRAGGDGTFNALDGIDYVSIHAPRAGGDTGRRTRTLTDIRFNPRPLRLAM